MTDVVAILLVELVVGRAGEAAAPEDERLLERQANALEEQAVLPPRRVLEVLLLAQRVVHVAHAEREVLPRETVDHHRRDRLAAVCLVPRHVLACDARQQTLRQVVEHGHEPVILVQSRQGARGDLVVSRVADAADAPRAPSPAAT